jgi:hypothetical protein
VLPELRADVAPPEAEYVDDRRPLHRLWLSRQSGRERVRQAWVLPVL